MTPEQLHNAYTAQVSPLPRPPLPDPPALVHPVPAAGGTPSPPVCPGSCGRREAPHPGPLGVVQRFLTGPKP